MHCSLADCSGLPTQDVDGLHKMDEGNVAVLTILGSQTYKPNMVLDYNNADPPMIQEQVDISERKNQNVIWTKNATLMLLNLYETKMGMLDHPKKKSRLWLTMANELKTMNIEVTPDQVRWKINALTKKYKDCIDNGRDPMSFKFFNEMHQILGRNTDDLGNYTLGSGILNADGDQQPGFTRRQFYFKSQAPFRRLRAEHKAKMDLDKQWMQYLKRQEEQRLAREERYERSLKLKEEELQLQKKELEMKQALAVRRLQLKEKKQEEMLNIEKEKCAILQRILDIDSSIIR